MKIGTKNKINNHVQQVYIYVMVKQTSLFPFSKANRACFIPVTETSILDRSTE